MASTVGQQIEATLNKQINKVIQDRLLTAVRAGANGVRDHALQTARKGIGIKGETMPSYSAPYKRMKAKYIATGKYGKRTLKRTAFAATSVNDKTVLTGNTHKNIVVKNVKAKQDAQGFIQASFTIGPKDKRTADVLDGLREKGYTIGKAQRATKAGREQEKIFLKELQKTLGFRGGAVGLSEA